MSNYLGVNKDDPTFTTLKVTDSITRGTATALTALAGGGQTGATLVNCAICKVGTVATIADSVILPPAKGGIDRFVINAGANSVNVFPAVGDTINALAANTAYALAAGKAAHFAAPADGAWFVNLSA